MASSNKHHANGATGKARTSAPVIFARHASSVFLFGALISLVVGGALFYAFAYRIAQNPPRHEATQVRIDRAAYEEAKEFITERQPSNDPVPVANPFLPTPLAGGE